MHLACRGSGLVLVAGRAAIVATRHCMVVVVVMLY